MIQLGGQLVDATQFLTARLLGGDVKNFHLSLQSAKFFSGSEIEFAKKGITVIVGSNNAGKSTVIRELVNRLHASPDYDPNPYKIIESVNLGTPATPGDLAAWFMTHATYRAEPHARGFVRGSHQHPIDLESISFAWGDRLGIHQLGNLAPFFVHHSSPFERIGNVRGASQRPNFTDPPQAPMHYIEDSAEIREQIKSYSQRVFGESLTVDYLSAEMQFRVGTTSTPAPPIDDVSTAYRRELASLPLLQEQGDGMTSLLGLLIPLATTPFPIVLADEPEAFLHPPQAVALGKILGEISHTKGTQIILATHDKNLLAGLMASSAPVSVVRLDRRGSEVRASQLKDEALRELWRNPALKYSNALDGLFHKLVVIAEADPDCRFYAAALEHLLEESKDEFNISSDDVLFIPSGGLGDMPKLTKALRDLSVPVVASPDMDAISDVGIMKKLVSALGGSWQDFQDSDKKLRVPFSTPKSPRTVGVVLKAIHAALKGHELERYATDHKKFVEAELYVDSVWREVKRYGVRAFRGESRAAVGDFLEKASGIGLVPLHAGELESLSDVGVSKGPEWLPAALEAGSHKNEDTQTHVRNILVARDRLMNH
ncbi:AAA family ATPase [Streptomyces sp. NPDC008122]|uniref:ATP-dependent nuclease n=1 Tax=Streptomyces sp. NPDC008122 TaxID=3364810 RepID=UPI0036F189E1